MASLYLTADRIGEASGGGRVTKEESEALAELGECEIFGRERIEREPSVHTQPEPWLWDERMYHRAINLNPKLAHVYAGTFSHTIGKLKDSKCMVAYTAAAHSIQASRQAHLELGIDFDKMYPHLIDPEQWKRYLAGYLAADVVVCPSRHSRKIMEGYGCKRVEVIPHGVDIPEEAKLLPSVFTVGMLGAIHGPDKGLIDVLRAWKKLNYKDTTLVLGGSASASPFVLAMVEQFGGGNIRLLGWLNHVEDFYNGISLLVQASRSEGFGMEVLESMAHGRLALCSTGAGAADVALEVFPSGDVEALVTKIDYYKMNPDRLVTAGVRARSVATAYTWDIIRERYKTVWRNLLGMMESP